MKKEVLPHIPDAWIDYKKTKIGYDIPINRHFYVYKPPRDLEIIEEEIEKIEKNIAYLLKEVIIWFLIIIKTTRIPKLSLLVKFLLIGIEWD